MMKKALLYAVTAILLGTVTMVAPLRLLKPIYFELITTPGVKNASTMSEALDGEQRTYGYGEAGALERAVSPSNLWSAGLILIPSFLLALSVSLYLKKRMF